MINKILLIFIFSIIMVSCNSVPMIKAPRPWIRSLAAGNNINPNSTASIVVQRESTPLVSDENLAKERIISITNKLLQRRGFTVENKFPQYIFKIRYKTERTNKFKAISTLDYSK